MSIELSRRDEFAIITLSRPEALNALNVQMIKDIGAAINEAGASDARAVIFTGAGDKAFCAGADIKELLGRSLIEAKHGAELGQWTFAKLDRMPMPSVAAINGYAFGGCRTDLQRPRALGVQYKPCISFMFSGANIV